MKILCKKCNEIIEDPLKSGTLISCECGSVKLDVTDFYCRVIGSDGAWEEILVENI